MGEKFEPARCENCDRMLTRVWKDTGLCAKCDDRPDPAGNGRRPAAFQNGLIPDD